MAVFPATRLDRYVLAQWVRLFLVTAVGFPIVALLIDLTDSLSKLLDRGVGLGDIFLGYAYQLPEKMFEVIPAAVLFATVFVIGSLGRNSELTAAKAGGVSFHRIALPLYAAAALAAALCLAVGELAPGMTRRQLEIHQEKARATGVRYNFVYRAEQGWVYTIKTLDTRSNTLRDVILSRQGTGPAYPSLIVTADSATWDTVAGRWRLWNGYSRVVADGERQAAFAFTAMRLRAMTQEPIDLLAEPKKPEEMRYDELGRYIDAVERSGSDADRLRVKRALKLAIPATCLIIALFGAPLAVTSYRSGTAVGVGISLGTTIAFLLLVQLSEAIGAGGVLRPELAAWMPNALFLVTALGLQARVRT